MRSCRRLEVSGREDEGTYRTIPEIESIRMPLYLRVEVHQECSDCVLVGLPNFPPQPMLSIYNLYPLDLGGCRVFARQSMTQQGLDCNSLHSTFLHRGYCCKETVYRKKLQIELWHLV